MTVKDVANIHYGKALKKDDRVESGDIDVFGSNGAVGIHDEFLFDEPTVIIGRKGSVGKTIYTEDESWTIDTAFYSEIDKSKIVIKYFYYALMSKDMEKYAITTSIPGINRNDIYNLKIPLPSLEEQKAIVAKLDRAQRLIDIDKEMLAKYDQLIQSMFLEMFGDPVTNPKGWERFDIHGLASGEKNSIKAGPFGSSLKKEFYVEKGYKIYGQEQVIRDDFNYGDYYINQERFEKLKNCEIKKDDVLISLVGSYGYISVVPEGIERGIINPRLMKISFEKDKVLPFFFKSLFTNESFEKLIEDQTHGGTMGILNTTIVKKLNIPVPPISLQESFLNKLKAIKGEMSEIEKSLKKSKDLFSSLLQGVFG
ncbi:MAG: restriction endonuclease subunit S [Balneola sp.]